jgi:hypothetical protein
VVRGKWDVSNGHNMFRDHGSRVDSSALNKTLVSVVAMMLRELVVGVGSSAGKSLWMTRCTNVRVTSHAI